jgi:DNA mismatch repair ATPase MutS
MGISFVQSLVQPIQNAMHLYKTDQTACTNGAKIIELRGHYEAFNEECKANNIKILLRQSLTPIPEDPRRAIRILMEEPDRFRLCMKDMAELEILWRLSQCAILKPTLVIETGGPFYHASKLRDISLGDTGVPSSVFFDIKSHHAVLTGPNGGGKSSFLRAILQGVLIGQSYGVAPAEGLSLRRFGWISSGLRLQDAPGNLSMFETEVWFAANLLKRDNPSDAPGLVLYDELFHSTNPPDGIRTAERFLNRLWKTDSMLTIVSTHVFSLVENAPESVKRLCCFATLKPDGDIDYKFNIQPGICTVSSVKSIWKRFDL